MLHPCPAVPSQGYGDNFTGAWCGIALYAIPGASWDGQEPIPGGLFLGRLFISLTCAIPGVSRDEGVYGDGFA
jgi:hypothetical protein